MKTVSKFLMVVLMVFIAEANIYAKPLLIDDQPYLTKDFSLSGAGNLEVQTSGGSITVIAQEGNKVRVEMYVRKGSKSLQPNDANAQEWLEDYSFDISKTNNSVKAIAERESSISSWFGNNNVSISFKVFVPEEMETNLKTSGGSINLTGVTGRQELHTSGGSINLEKIRGQAKARTSGGSIQVEEYAGILDAHTSGGSIHLQDSKGELTVHTSGGSIKIDNVEGSIDASTSGGGINANLLAITKHVKLHTSGGSITAVVPGGLGLDLDLKGNRVNTKLQNFNGEAEKDRIKGSMNGGGIPIVMSTSGGSVNLKYQ